MVLLPWLETSERHARSPEAKLEEAVGLALAIDLEVVDSAVIKLRKPRPSTLFGKGTLDDYAAPIKIQEIELVIVDGTLTPGQQRNLERAWHCKVIDRTALILEIFGARARTNEGKLQVELAALTYQKSRLVRSWTHLERQRGGFGFMGGPGERQLELDRRLLSERITRLKQDLAKVKQRRELQRSARKRVPYPVVALVGYTNAGKSTLFNRLTRAAVTAEDKLFATLDPTMRRVRLKDGLDVILSDTVGFISDLPTHLVAAFRATLEEVTEADLILHVRDLSHPDSAAQAADVDEVLTALGLGDRLGQDLIQVGNKIDRLSAEEVTAARAQAKREPNTVVVSALTGEGIDDLLDIVSRGLRRAHGTQEIAVRLSDGAALSWLYRHGQVLERNDDDEYAHLKVRLAKDALARFESRRNSPA